MSCYKTARGDKFYYKDGTNILHREDGPAVEYANGDGFWFINNVRYSEQEFNKIMLTGCGHKFVPNTCQKCNTINEYADPYEAILSCWNCK